MPIVVFILMLFVAIPIIYFLIKRQIIKSALGDADDSKTSFDETQALIRKYKKNASADNARYVNDYHKIAAGIYKDSLIKSGDEKITLLKQSVDLYELANQVNPNDTEILRPWTVALLLLARSTNDDALYREAIQHIEQANQLLPNNADIYCEWAEVIDAYSSFTHDLLLTRQALELLTQALSLATATADIYEQLADVLLHIGMQTRDRKYFDECFDNYQKAVNLDPNSYWLYTCWANSIGYCGIFTNDTSLFPQMAEKYNRAIELENTESGQIVFSKDLHLVPSMYIEQLMRMLEHSQDDFLYQESLKTLAQIEKSKTNPEVSDYLYWGYVLYTLAEIKSDNELYKQSCKQFEAAHRLNPEDDQHLIYWAIALLYQSTQSANKALLNQARSKIEEAVRVSSHPENVYQTWGDAITYMANKKDDASLFKESAAIYSKVIEQYPELGFAYFRKAQCLIDEAKLNNNKYISTKSIETLLQKSLDMGYKYDNTQQAIYIYMLKLAAFVDDRSLFFEWMQKAIEEYGIEEMKSNMDQEEFEDIKTDPRYQQLVNEEVIE